MLTREQIYTMLMLRKREDNIFSVLPDELICHISDFGQDSKSDITKALRHAAYARKDDIAKVVEMVKANPRIPFEAGNVVTPGGLDLRRVTLYEFFLGAGDPDAAQQIEPYFAKIENGENERVRQYERYRPHIEGMLTQTPYNIASIIDIIKRASADDVTAMLNKDMKRESVLRDALIQFRKDFAPGMLIKPRMHYNYRSLLHAFDMLDGEWSNLFRVSGNNYYHQYRVSGNNHDNTRLVWRQLIGFEMRRLPGIDRCAMAQGLFYVKDQNEVKRTYKFKNGAGDFPITGFDESLDGLGGDFAIDIIGARDVDGELLVDGARLWKNYVEKKTSALLSLSPEIENWKRFNL